MANTHASIARATTRKTVATQTEQPRVYAYSRFSDPKQARGASIARQTERAEKWARDHGMALDTTLSLRDEGLSAYHQRNLTRGALGVFLRAVEDGKVRPGSVLAIESLDRLSRAEPIVANNLLTSIVLSGINVVALGDGNAVEYNRENVRRNPGILFLALGTALRANEESETKSSRVRDALRRMAKGWIAGTWRGVIRSGQDPNWIKIADTGEVGPNGKPVKRPELIPERVAAVRMVIELYREGFGLVRIARELEQNGMALSEGAKSQVRAIHNMLRLEALIGRRTVTIARDETYKLDGYYPAVISPEEFAEVQVLLGQRVRYGAKSSITAVVTGLGVTHCGHCGSRLVAQNHCGRRLDARGLPTASNRKMLCNSYHKALPCKVRGTLPAPLIESSILECCADDFNLEFLVRGDAKRDVLAGRLAIARQAVAKLEQQRDNFAMAIGYAEDKEQIRDLMKKHLDVAQKAMEKRAEVEKIEYETAQVNGSETPASSDIWRSLLEGVKNMDDVARVKARKLVADTFKRVDVYMHGVDGDRPEAIDMLLVSKREAAIVLRINVETEEWKAEHIDGKKPPEVKRTRRAATARKAS